MNVWLKVQVLVMLFCLSSSAPMNLECQPLLESQTLDGPSKLFGNWTFIRGYNSYDIYKHVLKIIQVSKTEIKAGNSADEVVMIQENKMNGTCLGSTSIMTFENRTATFTVSNITAAFHFLPTCNNCMLLRINYTSPASAINKLLQAMNFNEEAIGEDVTATALYLFSKDLMVDQSDLNQFTDQAKCLGFTQDPDFIYDPKEGYCDKDEIIQIQVK